MAQAHDNLLSNFNFTKKRNWVADFLHFDIQAFDRLLRERTEDFWQRAGEKRALQLFHFAAEHAPAYKDFLKKHRIRHQKIKTIKDFAQVPVTTKENYIRVYPLNARCWNGALSTNDVVAVSSGTSGEPTVWPRAGFQEFEAAIIHELLYRYLFQIHEHKTLLIIGFPMGIYVSGMATVLPSWLVSQKGYPLTLVTVGTNKDDLLRIARLLKEHYRQVALAGHPFFIKDVLETGRELGIQWEKQRVRMMFVSEGFSEEWRRYVLSQAGLNPSLANAAVSVYGCSELLLIAMETPLTLAVKHAIAQNEAYKKEFLNNNETSNLFQYNPFFRYVEAVHNELIFTSASGVPLIRYNLHDAGQILPLQKASQILEQTRQYQKTANQKTAWQLPLVALWGRSDQTIILYAANIYPEHIRQALQHSPFLNKLTGKFSMRKQYTKNMEEALEINIELRKGIPPDRTLSHILQRHIFESLCKTNLEYLDLSSRHVGKKAYPKIKLWPYQHPQYFKPGLKPKYIVK